MSECAKAVPSVTYSKSSDFCSYYLVCKFIAEVQQVGKSCHSLLVIRVICFKHTKQLWDHKLCLLIVLCTMDIEDPTLDISSFHLAEDELHGIALQAAQTWVEI